MKVWVLLEEYSDGCSFFSTEVISIHMSEEGSFLEGESIKKLQLTSSRGNGVSIVEFEVKQ